MRFFNLKNFNKKDILFSVISGIFLGISFPPFPLYHLVFVALVPYLFTLQNRSSLAEISRITYLTFFVFGLITLYWVGSWMPDADPFLLVAGTALMFFNPIPFLIPSTLFYLVRKHYSKNWALALFPFFWVFYEYVYGLTDLRFPWLALGHSLAYFKSFIQTADLVGTNGLSLIVVAFNVLIFVVIKNELTESKKRKLLMIVAGLIFIIPIIYGRYKISSYEASDKNVKVGLIQPNLDPWNKWEAGNLEEQLDLYLALSDSAISEGAELIIWPETALPKYLLTGAHRDEVFRIRKFVKLNNIALLTGMPHANYFFDKSKAPGDAKPTPSGKYLYTSYNAILGFDPVKSEIQKYFKIKLVPFGEHVPFVEELPFLGDFIKWNVGISSWNVGKEQNVFNFNLNGNQVSIGGLVCIESIYPAFTADFVRNGAELIAVVTNDSWYGDSSGPYQHRDFAILRAVENKRSVVRAANGGISAIINPIGEVKKETNMYTKDYLVGSIELNSEMTFYSKHPRLILYISSFISLISFLLCLIKKYYGRSHASN